MTTVERSAMVAAPPDAVWDVLADFGALASWVPMIQHSCLLSDQRDDVGAVRRVQIARQTLVERVTNWDPPSELSYAIEGLPPIVGAARNTWRLAPAGDRTRVVVTTELDTGRNPARALIAKRVLQRMAIASEQMLAGLADAATASLPTTEESP